MSSNSTVKGDVQQRAEDYYSTQSFWSKFKKASRQLSEDALEKLLILYYCFKDPKTPRKEKAIIVTALGYFVMPFDAIPDLLPGGWTDDIGVLAIAIAKVANSINASHIEKARRKLNKWTGRA